jgi:hypothetical protein
MPRKSNPYAKTRPIDNPYAEFQGGNGFVWRVLKTYQHPDNEKQNPYARWFVAAKSDLTHGSWEYGDTYARDVQRYGRPVKPFEPVEA